MFTACGGNEGPPVHMRVLTGKGKKELHMVVAQVLINQETGNLTIIVQILAKSMKKLKMLG